MEYNDDQKGENFIEVSFTYVDGAGGTKTSSHLIIIVGNVGPVN